MRRGPRAAGLLLGIALLSFGYGLGLQAFVVRSDSMAPTLQRGDVVLAEHLSDLLGGPRRGQARAFRFGRTWYLKRLVGLPGDALALRGRTLYRNGRPVTEPGVWYRDGGLEDLPARLLGPGQYLLLGDNRDRSQDSRDMGAIPGEHLGGRLFLRLWPPRRLGRLD